MTTTTTCCGSTTTCTTQTVLRPRFYPKQIVTPDDLTLMQDYFRARMRWHNLMMHGWGVACGALVCPSPSTDGSGPLPWTVIVRRGYVLGPCGDEIIIDCDRSIDLRTSGVTGVTGDACVEPVDPWCSDVYKPNQPQKLYIAIRYKEVMTRPVRVQPYGCGCDDSRCEYSRWRDGYEIGVLTACPCPPAGTPPVFTNVPTGSTPVCPCSPETSWVGLTEVDVDGDGNITGIDNCSCRRLVVSFGNFWWSCTGAQEINISQNPAAFTIAQGKGAQLQFSATNLQMSATPDLGTDISISALTVDTTKGTIAFAATAAANATLGSRTLTIRNGDCTWGTLTDAVSIVAATAGTTTKTAPAKKTAADKTTGSNGG
jgi:hypothetical protein